MSKILIEDTVYSVPKKELLIIRKMERDIKNAAGLNYKILYEADFKLSNYLDENKHKYKRIGVVEFQYRY